MSARGDAEAIVDAALASAAPVPLEAEQRYAVTVPQGADVRIVKPASDEERGVPRRVAGTTVVRDVDSLDYLWKKHANESSELFADPVAFSLTGVLNADGGSGLAAGFRDHRIELKCRKTPAWLAWEQSDGQLLNQQAFAEFIEDRVLDITRPTGGEMLELAQSIEATTKVDFKSATAISSGQRTLMYEETMQAKAGQRGQLEIPATFDLALKPFEGGPAYKVVARLRYRIMNGNLAIGFKLERPEDVLEEAFGEVSTLAGQACDTVVLSGTAPAPRVSGSSGR